jgi:hypothetical protein
MGVGGDDFRLRRGDRREWSPAPGPLNAGAGDAGSGGRGSPLATVSRRRGAVSAAGGRRCF